MKITKRQLRKIIKEEKAKLLNEDNYDPMADADMGDFGGLNRERRPGDPKTYSSAASIESATKQLEDAITAMLEVLPRMELAEELREYAKDVAMNRPLGS